MVQEQTTPQEKAHTALPWKQSHRQGVHDDMYRTEIYDQSGEPIATVAWYPVHKPGGVIATAREANAAFIVRACNSHYQLLEALKAALPHLHWANTHADRCDEAIKLAEQAISAAEEGL